MVEVGVMLEMCSAVTVTETARTLPCRCGTPVERTPIRVLPTRAVLVVLWPMELSLFPLSHHITTYAITRSQILIVPIVAVR